MDILDHRTDSFGSSHVCRVPTPGDLLVVAL
jgi:hypothetical protein